ncbi:MAG: alpha/beta fold hydrolase [Myxococcales bacterium]|nr:alpha/beta fold hydrolase [Myxococcales bacterium]
MNVAVEILGAALVVALGAYAVVTTGVALFTLYGQTLKRWNPKDAAQAAVFADVAPSVWLRLPALLVEGACQTMAFTLQALHTLRVLPPPRGPAGGTPLVLLPGYTENEGTIWWLSRRFARAGFTVYPITFPSTFHALERNMAFLHQRVREIRARHGGERVAVVAHSMGGVITRALTLSEPDHGVKALVAFASPFRGTNLAPPGALLRMGRSVAQMRAGSDFNRQYGPERELPVPALGVIAPQENIVTPEWSIVVAGVDVRVLSMPWGHEAPLFMRTPFELTRRWLLDHGVRRGGET